MASYNKNQYIKIDEPVEEIAKIEINYSCMSYDATDTIEDLELEGDENVLIYSNEEGDGEEFINIFGGVRIMITNERTINKDKYKKLPKNIEYVIVNNIIYDVRDDNDMMYFMKKETVKEYIREIIESGRYDESSMDRALSVATYKGLVDEIKELKRMMKEE